jgi:hypothetical protein
LAPFARSKLIACSGKFSSAKNRALALRLNKSKNCCSAFRPGSSALRSLKSASDDHYERGLAHFQRIAPQVVAVQFNEVESVEEHVPVMLAVADTVERCEPVLRYVCREASRPRFPKF